MLEFPFDATHLLRKRRALARSLRESNGLTPLRLAVLGGASTQEISAWLELFLLDRGVSPTVHQAGFNRYFEDTVLDPRELQAFSAEVVYLHLATDDFAPTLSPTTSEADFEAAIASARGKLQSVLDSISVTAVLNTLEAPALRPLGSLDATAYGGTTHFVARFNLELAKLARSRPQLILHDAASVAATSPHAWYSPDRWFNYKMRTTTSADAELAYSLAATIAAIRGRSRKCLVLDLDNTLWGGVIGDDGVDRIVIGRETPRGEAHTAFQQYCRRLKERGILLAVCSKNDDAVARQGFTHPDSVLRLDDFAAFRANWEPKSENIQSIADELNIGLDSFVFVDDNPAERHLVAEQLPMVAVPNVGNDPSVYATIVDRGRYFESVTLSPEDLARTAQYAQNAERQARAATFSSYGEYLESLGMAAEIDAFHPRYLDRIAQLTNKTNQFNLTTRRYSRAEIEACCADDTFLTLYGRLSDIFGDNGLVSVVMGRRELDTLFVDLWLMSCRVLKRGMEQAMLDALVLRAQAIGVNALHGTYLPSGRNGMVEDFYGDLGFRLLERDSTGRSEWQMELTTSYTQKNSHIRVQAHGDHS